MTGVSWPQVIGALMRREDLAAETAAAAMDQIMDGAATPAQIAGFAVALRAKGETVDEVGALVAAMLRHAKTVEVPGRVLDVVGTGGDGAHTVNISTMSAIVAAAAGATVVKHGNRAASSSCGSADLVEALGIPLELTPEQVVEVAGEVGITFCFARAFHPALRHAGPVRAELGVPTTFNFLGPLANPAQPQAMALGVADPRMAPIMAGVLAARGVSALVFRGEDGLDELSIGGPSRVWVVRDGSVAEETVDAADLGIARADAGALRGGDAAHNAEVARALVAGRTGPVRDTVLLNTAAALVAYEPGDAPLADQLAAGVKRAAEAIDSGAAEALLDRWVAAVARFSAA